MKETWRVVLADGTARDLTVLLPEDGHRWSACGAHLRGAGFGDSRDEAIERWLAMNGDVREIVPPGEPTRAELTTTLAIVRGDLNDHAALADGHDARLREEIAAARADHAAAETHLAAIVSRWEAADHDSQSLADIHVPGLRAEIEEARDGREGEWWKR